MKSKNISLCLLLLALITVWPTQRAAAQFGKAGIKGGLNVSNLYVDDVNDENPRYGFNLGVYGQPYASDVFALQVELLYDTKGARTIYDGIVYQEVKYNLNYLTLPVLGVFKLGESAEIHFGGYTGYLLDANISYSGDISNGVDRIEKSNLKSMDYGLSGGFALNFGMTTAGVRYNYGLAKIAESDAAKSVLGDSKNSCAQIYVAFNLSK